MTRSAALHVDEYVAVLLHDGQRLAEVAGHGGLDARIPTCPGWQVRDLLRHLGGVHRWAASHVASGRPEPYTTAEEAAFFATVPDGALIEWFRQGHRTLVDTLATADPSVSCWTFLPAPSPLAFWARRQSHETAIHRADAESAVPSVPAWDPRFAVDGIDELLNGFFARPESRIRAGRPASIALCASDAAAAWTVYLDAAGHRLSPGRHPAELVVTGPASDLYLLLWNRAGAERLDTRGDLRALDSWRAHARIRWA